MTKEEAFVKYKEIFDYAEVGKNLEEIVNIDELMTTPASASADSGLAYEGAILFHTLMIWHFANKLSVVYNNISPVFFIRGTQNGTCFSKYINVIIH